MMCIKSWSCSLKHNCKTYTCLKCGEKLEMSVAKKREETCCGIEMGSVTFLCLQVFHYLPLGAKLDVKVTVRRSTRTLDRLRLWFTVSQSSVQWGFSVPIGISQFNSWCLSYLIKHTASFCYTFVSECFPSTDLQSGPLLPPPGRQGYDMCLVHSFTTEPDLFYAPNHFLTHSDNNKNGDNMDLITVPS